MAPTRASAVNHNPTIDPLLPSQLYTLSQGRGRVTHTRNNIIQLRVPRLRRQILINRFGRARHRRQIIRRSRLHLRLLLLLLLLLHKGFIRRHERLRRSFRRHEGRRCRTVGVARPAGRSELCREEVRVGRVGGCSGVCACGCVRGGLELPLGGRGLEY